MNTFHECTNPECGLRFPLDLDLHKGKFCPRCGEIIKPVAEGQNHQLNMPRNHEIPLWGLLDNIRSGYNVGSVFRIADGAGLSQLFLCGITPNPDENDQVCKTALGSEKSVPWQYYPNAFNLVKQLKNQGYSILALELTPSSISLFDYEVAKIFNQPMILVVGSERAGIDPGILALCDASLSIPMHGHKESLNVSVAFGIAAYWLSHLLGKK